jgi:CheY-like chemotaxis protein
MFNDIIPSLNTINLIIAEDDIISQKVISGYMNLANIKYTLVKNGLECIQALQAVDGNFNGILMDVHMTEIDGIEATKLIRMFNTTIPIIALTAGVTQEEQAKCRAAGMDAILMKPFDPRNLADTISHYLLKT